MVVVGGRREDDPIIDLETETRPFLTLTRLATYFAVGRRFLVDCADAGILKVYTLNGTEWRVKLADARAFERSQIRPAANSPKKTEKRAVSR
jgi:hypothetical protein